MKSILDPTFRYTPSVATDIRMTFERIRRQALPRVTPRSSVLPPIVRVLLGSPR